MLLVCSQDVFCWLFFWFLLLYRNVVDVEDQVVEVKQNVLSLRLGYFQSKQRNYFMIEYLFFKKVKFKYF